MKLNNLLITLHYYLQAYYTVVNAYLHHVHYLLRVRVVGTFLLGLLSFAGEGKSLITLIKFEGRQNLHDSNIVTLRNRSVWVISCGENINLIYHKLHPTYALLHTILREVKCADANALLSN